MGFKLFVVDPTFTKLPNGNYGEAYGYVSFLRLPVYVMCGLVILIGLWLVVKDRKQPPQLRR